MLKYLLPIVIAFPAFATEPTEFPDLWYDLLAAEELAKLVDSTCSEIELDYLETQRLRRVASDLFADFDIINGTPTKAFSMKGMLVATLRVGAGIPLTGNICEFAEAHIEQQTNFGTRLKHSGE